MSDDLVERVARAICKADGRYDYSQWARELRPVARAALASIEAAGYVVVPREQTRYKRALEQCAAGCVLPPGTFNEVSKYITKEFSRRIKLANDALSPSNAALERDKANDG